jgi:methylaspartate mutase epsilon subunit
MLGQLCPPGLLVALSVLEARFFAQHGVRSVSLSYAQQTDAGQDTEAILALRRLAWEFLPSTVDRHLVLYTYMGVFPTSAAGARRLLAASARLAVRAGVERLIVKTAAEAHRIPTIDENVDALETAALTGGLAAATADPGDRRDEPDSETYREARALVEMVLDLDDDLGRALPAAFRRGYLDVPFCLHPDNAGRSRGFIDGTGRLRWSAAGRMPVRAARPRGRASAVTSAGLLAALHHVSRAYDAPPARSRRHQTSQHHH